MRYLIGVVALAPFVVLLVAMATRRVRVRSCCGVAGRSDERRTVGSTPSTVGEPAAH